ncbi:MAG: hypothetical protein IKB86_03375 [Clostridia bacterium]|nr:hypothetical protein [Clostridia bacterium]
MMAKEVIKDYTGKIIGAIEWSGNKKWLSDFYGRRLGYYDKSLDKTFDFYGRMIGYGDIVLTLLR